MAATPMRGYGADWVVGGVGRGRRLHTARKLENTALSLCPSLCGLLIDWFIADETFIERWAEDHPFCKRCDARMR